MDRGRGCTGLYADDIVLKYNMGYLTPGLSAQPEVQVGRDSTNGSVVLTNNYLPMGLLMNNWTTARVSGNLFAPRPTNYALNLNQMLIALSAEWNNNTYVRPNGGQQVLLDSVTYGFAGWQAATGFDGDSTFVVGGLQGTRIFVRPNLYEPGRANIIVYNWDNLDNVTVDVKFVLPLGSDFEVRNAQNIFAAPVLRGVFRGEPLQLPMTNLTVASPNGPMLAPPPTGPTFNVFVLLPRPGTLEVRHVRDSVQVYWPVGFGTDALQSKDGLAIPGSWADSTNTPVVAGDQFMITEPASSGAKFYRLQTTPVVFNKWPLGNNGNTYAKGRSR